MKFDQFLVLVAVSVVIIGIWSLATNLAQAKTVTPTITPTQLTATAVSPTQINLSWLAPTENYGKTIIGYRIEQELSTGAYYTIVGNTGRALTTYSLTGLTTDTTYTFRVSAVYSDDTSTDPSSAASARPTLSSSPSPTPPISSPITNVKFDFTPSDGTTMAAAILSQNDYQVLQYKKDSRSVISNAMATTEVINNNLDSILAYQNNHLSSPDVPGPLIARAVSPTQIKLSWLPPLENYGASIIGYKIDWKKAPGDYVIIDDNTGNTTTRYFINSLTSGTLYTYRVSAIYTTHTITNPSNEASATPLAVLQPTPQPTPPSSITQPPTSSTPPHVTNVKFDFTPSDRTTLTSVIITQDDYQQLIVIKDPRSIISNVTQTTETINNDLAGLLRYQTIHSSQETTPQQTYNYTPTTPNNPGPNIGLLWGVATSVIAFGIIGIISWLVKTKIAKKILKEYHFTMEKFIEDGIQLIRIRNSGQTIEDCTILCGGKACTWSDTKIAKPRHVLEGSISTVGLPDRYEDHSLISVKSGKKVLKKIQLGDMAHG